jgi:alpha-N-arabinofuranosidase
VTRDPERTFDNPILPGMNPDPSICRVGDDFYLVTSSFEYFPGVPIHHSRDLVHWRQIGHVLARREQLDLGGVPSSGGIYAPTLRHHAGRFYMITTLVGGSHGNRNFFVTATDPRGPWSDPIWLDEEGFDPSLLFAAGDVYYLRDGKGADEAHPRIYQTRIDPATGALREPMRPIWDGTGGIWPEGAHVYEIAGRYYLFAAEGGTSFGHSEVVGRSASPFGPFEPFARNPILTHSDQREHPIQATGHADLVALDDGSFWAVLLGIRPHDGRHHLGRETFLVPVHFDADGWPLMGDARDGGAGRVALRMPAPRLPAHPFPPEPARDDFDAPALAPAWSFVRNPDAADVSLTARPGHMRLVGSPVTLDEIASPALVVRRQQHFRVRCRAALDFAPRAPNEAAGLTVRGNESFRYDLAVRLGPSGREALLTSRIAGVSTPVARAPLPAAGAVELEVVTDETSYEFKLTAGAETVLLGKLPAQALSAEEIGKFGRHHFTGAVIGLYATGNGTRCTAPADFDWFEYAP